MAGGNILDRVDPRIRRGLSVSAVRLLSEESEPPMKPYESENVVVGPLHHQSAAKAHLSSRIRNKHRRKAKRRG